MIRILFPQVEMLFKNLGERGISRDESYMKIVYRIESIPIIRRRVVSPSWLAETATANISTPYVSRKSSAAGAAFPRFFPFVIMITIRVTFSRPCNYKMQRLLIALDTSDAWTMLETLFWYKVPHNINFNFQVAIKLILIVYCGIQFLYNWLLYILFIITAKFYAFLI